MCCFYRRNGYCFAQCVKRGVLYMKGRESYKLGFISSPSTSISHNISYQFLKVIIKKHKISMAFSSRAMSAYSHISIIPEKISRNTAPNKIEVTSLPTINQKGSISHDNTLVSVPSKHFTCPVSFTYISCSLLFDRNLTKSRG